MQETFLSVVDAVPLPASGWQRAMAGGAMVLSARVAAWFQDFWLVH
jgi:hypothetical protein